MSKLSKLKSKKEFKEPKVWLEGVNFDFEKSEDSPLGGHLHYVTQAASLRDEPLLLKAKDKDLTEDETKILKDLNTQKKDKDMDDKVLKELNDKIDTLVTANENAEKENIELKKQLKIDNIKKDIKDFALENEDEIIKALEDVEDMTEILKAFTFLKDFEVEKEEVEENELQKQLKDEAGKDGEADVVEKSFNEQIKDARKTA